MAAKKPAFGYGKNAAPAKGGKKPPPKGNPFAKKK